MTYDRWLQSAADDYYDDDEPAGYISQDHVVNQDYCAELVQSLIDAVYMTGNIDTIENALDGLVREFHTYGHAITAPKRDATPVIKQGVFESFANLTRCYAASLKKKDK